MVCGVVCGVWCLVCDVVVCGVWCLVCGVVVVQGFVVVCYCGSERLGSLTHLLDVKVRGGVNISRQFLLKRVW